MTEEARAVARALPPHLHVQLMELFEALPPGWGAEASSLVEAIYDLGDSNGYDRCIRDALDGQRPKKRRRGKSEAKAD